MFAGRLVLKYKNIAAQLLFSFVYLIKSKLIVLFK